MPEKQEKPHSSKTFAGNFVDFSGKTQEKFAQILFIKVLHHFDTLENIKTALENSLKILEPGGRIVIFEPNGKNILWKWSLIFKKDPFTGKSKWHYEQNMKFTTARNFDAVFRDKALQYSINYHYVIPAFVLEKFKRYSLLKKINRKLERSFLKKFAFNISVVINAPPGNRPKGYKKF
jgi:SAM-dependent methyltransferase